jgi:hypothetical protein
MRACKPSKSESPRVCNTGVVACVCPEVSIAKSKAPPWSNNAQLDKPDNPNERLMEALLWWCTLDVSRDRSKQTARNERETKECKPFRDAERSACRYHILNFDFVNLDLHLNLFFG